MKKISATGRSWSIVSVILVACSMAGCDRTRNTTGWDYFPDMFYSTAYETNSENPNFKDRMTMRVPEPGTVPRDYTPFNYTRDPESRILAGKELDNPFSSTPESIARGKKIYSTFCLGCHGVLGDGNGHLFTSGLYPLKPHDLTDTEAIKLLDGEIYHSITLGFGSMGAHGAQIRPDDRWMLVLHIRDLQEEALKS